MTAHENKKNSVKDEWSAGKAEICRLCLASAMTGFGLALEIIELASPLIPHKEIFCTVTGFATLSGLAVGVISRKALLAQMRHQLQPS